MPRIYRAPRQIRFTKEGYERLKHEYDELLYQRKSAVDELQKARELGDLSENGFYKAARAKLSFIDARLRRFSFQLKQATIIEDRNISTIDIGTTVVVHDGKREFTYHIVGDLESNPNQSKISLFSPIGKALAGRHIGDEVAITIPTGTITYKIIKIS